MAKTAADAVVDTESTTPNLTKTDDTPTTAGDGNSPDTAVVLDPAEGQLAEILARLTAAEDRAATAERNADNALGVAEELARRAVTAEQLVERYRSGEEVEDETTAETDLVWVRPKGSFEFIYGRTRYNFEADRRVRIPREVANYLRGTHGYQKADALYQ